MALEAAPQVVEIREYLVQYYPLLIESLRALKRDQEADEAAAEMREFVGPDGEPYSPDFAAYGRACGADGYTVDSAAAFGEALRAALAARRPAVLDVPMVNEPVPTPGHWNIKDIYQGVFE